MSKFLIVRLFNNETLLLKYRYRWLDLIIGKNYLFTFKHIVYVSPKTPLESIGLPILMHEQFHSIQQQKFGPYVWLFKYLFDRKFRLLQEAEGYAIQINATLTAESRVALLKAATNDLCTYKYLWAASSKQQAWEEISKRCPAGSFLTL